MVKINKVYTRTGDDGTTGLVGGDRVSKHSPRVEAYGDVDELNSLVGLARTYAEKQKITSLSDKLASIQNQLFDLGAELATAPEQAEQHQVGLSDGISQQLETWIDELLDGIPELRSFVLPGGSELNSALHLCRTVSRRAERRMVHLSSGSGVRPLLLQYINRLSDLFFAMARYEAHEVGREEYLWQPSAKDS